jgi:heme-degrading monooxygenase HmoA
MIVIFNRLPVKKGAAGPIVERFANSWSNVQRFPGFFSTEVVHS